MTIDFDPASGLLRLTATGFYCPCGVLHLRLNGCEASSAGLEWRETAAGEWTGELTGCRIQVRANSGRLTVTACAQTDEVHLEQAWLTFPVSGFSPPLVAEHTQMQLRGEVPLEFARISFADRDLANQDKAASNGYTLYHQLDTTHTRTLGALLIGTLPGADALCRFRNLFADPHRQGAMGMRIDFECGCHIPTGQQKTIAALAFLAGDDPLGLLAEYGELWKNAVPPRPATRVCGWNSWDYYGGAVDDETVDENLTALADWLPEFSHLVLDDGWQVRWGEWEGAHTRFADGLRGVAGRIRQRGKIPGIWVAPLTMYCHCPFARKNRDCLLHDESGKIVTIPYSSGPTVLLDPTHPKVREYLHGVFAHLRAEGFEYFKIDFTQALLDPRATRWHERSCTRKNMLDLAMQTIREAAGDCYIVCGTFPPEVLAGRVEAARTANDIHNFWSHIKNSAWQLASNWWMHGRLFRSDPDFLLARCPANTGGDELINYINTGSGKPLQDGEWWVRGRMADAAELQVWATLVAVSGGDIICGDRLALLDESGREIIRTAHACATDGAARPESVFTDALSACPPSRWRGQRGGREVLALINWSDAPVQLQVTGSAAAYREVWSRRQVAAGAVVSCPPHGCLFLLAEDN